MIRPANPASTNQRKHAVNHDMGKQSYKISRGILQTDSHRSEYTQTGRGGGAAGRAAGGGQARAGRRAGARRARGNRRGGGLSKLLTTQTAMQYRN